MGTNYNNNHRKCSKCGITRSDDNSIIMHRFPKPGTDNILKAMAWATYCWPDKDHPIKSLSGLYKKNKVLCSKHFQPSMYKDNDIRLSKYAIPGPREYVTNLLQTLKAKMSVPSIVKQVNKHLY